MSSPDEPENPWVKKPAAGASGEPQPGWGQPQAGQPYPGQPQAGQPYPGQPYPGQPYPAQGYPPPGYGPPPGYPPYGTPQAYAAMVNFPKPTGWFIVNWLFLWPLAIYSLVSAWGNIDRALLVGDYAGAQYQAGRVRKFGIIALCVGIALPVLMVLLFAVVFGTATSTSVRIGG